MKSQTLTLLVIFNLAVFSKLFSQNVSINSSGNLPDASAMLDVSSTTKGFLMPRMSSADRDAITLPATGLTIFNTTIVAYQVNTGTAGTPVWSTLGTTSSTVTSVATGYGLSGGPITNTGTIIVDTSTLSNWYLRKKDSLGNTGFTTVYQNSLKQSQLNGTGFVKATGTTISYDNTTYLSGNQTITFTPTGDVTGSTTGTTSLTPALSIGANKVTLGQMAQVATGTFLGRTTAATGNVEAMTTAQAKTLLGITNSNSGDVTLAGQNYLSITGQVITANPIDVSGTNVTGTLAAGRFPALTGDVTNTVGTLGTTISNSAVSNAKLANMAANTFKANNTGSAAAPTDITGTQATAMLNNFTSTLKGLVPLSGGGTANFLRADGTWSPLSTTAWGLTGNSGTTAATNFIGTTDSRGFRIKGNNIQGLLVDSLGNVAVGSAPTFTALPAREKFLVDAGTTTSINAISAKGSIDSYLQLNIQNQSAGTNASSDIVATSNSGTETTNFIDMGINGSGNTANIFGNANDAYLYNQGENFFIANSTASKSLIFMTGGTDSATNQRMRITGTGNVGIGNAVPSEKLDVTGNVRFSGALMPNNSAGTSGYVLTSAGAGVVPTWEAPGNQTITFAPTGDVTGTTTGTSSLTPVLSIGANKVTLGQMAQVATGTFLGRTTAATGNVEAMTTAQAKTLLGITNSNSGDVTLAGQNYLTIAGQVITANPVDLSGTHATGTLAAARFPALTGDVTNTAGALGTTISNGVVSNAKLANMAANTFKANNTGSAAAPTDITGTQATAMLDNFTSSTKGLVPLSGGGTANFLRADGTWSPLSSTAWGLTGNSGTTAATNFLGTTDLKSLSIRTNGTERIFIDSLVGNVGIGTNSFDATNPEKFVVNAGVTSSVNAFLAKGSINNYFQMNIKNLSNGTGATTDIVATADNGSETTNYVDLGINGSGYTGSAIQTGVANDGYLISAGNDFYVVNSTANKSMLFLTGGSGVANERMRILANGRVGMGVQDPTAPFVVKDTMEIRRIGSLSQLLFTNTAGTGDFRIGGDGGDIFWQGGGGRGLQMGSYWTTILTGDRQTTTYPAFTNTPNGTGVLVQGTRDVSVPLGIQANSGTQSADLTQWRNSSGTALSVVNKDGNFGIGNSAPSEKLDVTGNVRFSGALMPNNLAGTSGYVLTSAGAGTAPTWAAPGNQTITFAPTGDVTGSTTGTSSLTPALSIGANKVTLGQMAQVATGTFLGRTTAATGNVEAMTTAQAKTLLGITNSNSGDVTLAGQNYLSVAGQVITANPIDVSGTNVTGTLAAGRFSALTGDVTNTVGTVGTTISNSAVSNAKLANMAANTFKANNTGSVAAPTDITGTQATAMLDNFTSTLKGLVPLSGGGTSNYLRADGTWSALPAALGSWSLTGNSGTTAATNFIGTTDSRGFRIKGNNIQGLLVDSLGNVAVGSAPTFTALPAREKFLVDAGTTTSINAISAKGSIDSYLQLNIQNQSAGTNASSDIVATSNSGTETTNFIDMGINGSGNTANIFGNANDAYLYNQGENFFIANSTASKSLIFMTGGTDSATNQRMRITGTGNVGIGNAAPADKLDVTGNVRFSGALMPGGSAGTAGYFLQSLGAGTAPQWFDASNFAWQLNGNPATSVKTLGNTTNFDLPFITNNIERMRINTSGDVAIGTTSFNSTNSEQLLVDAGATGNTNFQNVIVGKGNTNSYAQLNIQNSNAGTNASSDVVATADNGNETVNYIDMGMNSSANTANNFGGLNDAYLYAVGNGVNTGGNLIVGTATPSRDIAFLTGGGTKSSGSTMNNERMRILGTGNVGIGTNAPAATLDVAGTYKLGTAGTVLTNMLKTNVTVGDATTFNYTATKTYTATVTGATVNGTVIVNPRVALPTGISIGWARVSSADTITIGFTNTDTTARALGSITFDITVIQ